MVPDVGYDRGQDFNAITKFLHRGRHRHARRVIQQAQSELSRPPRVLDIGCGTGRTLAAIDDLDMLYHGIDLEPEFINAANAKYPHRSFAAGDATQMPLDKPDVVLALETLEHIPEASVVRLVEHICHELKPLYFLVTVPTEVGPAVVIKNLGSKIMGWDRREYTLKQTFLAGFYRLNRLPTHNTSHIGFNWVWLEQTLRHNGQIAQSRSLPFRWLPKAFAPNLLFLVQPRPD